MGSFAALHLRRSLVLASALALAACANNTGPADESTSEDVSAAGAAHQINPFLLQFVGSYEGPSGGVFQSLELLRDGSFIAVVKGQRKTGRFEGPTEARSAPLKIAFILGGDHFTATITQDWNKHQQISLTRQGVSEVLTSTWEAGTETMCDRSGGAWDDDDPDPDSGLDCVCPAPKVYIPSAGGCTK